jgi:SAM-dependent methyltransferase
VTGSHGPRRVANASATRDDWNRRYSETKLLWTATPSRFLVAETSDLPPGRALDLACGEGRNAVWLAERGWEVVGVDFADVGLATARRLAAERGVEIDFVHADLLAYEPEPLRYDLVCVLYLHLPADDRGRVLARAAAAVAPGGTFLLVAHDLENLERGHGGPSDARVLYTADEVADELPGLELVKAEQVLRPVDGAERPAIDALVRARRGELR